jgi:hypothetical protein
MIVKQPTCAAAAHTASPVALQVLLTLTAFVALLAMARCFAI